MAQTTTTFTLTVSESPTTLVGIVKSETAIGQVSADFQDRCGLRELKGYSGTLSGEPGYAAGRSTFSSSNTTFPSTLGYTGPMHYDPVRNRLWYIAGCTQAGVGEQTAHWYDVTANEWRHRQGQSSTDAVTGLWASPGLGQSHNFQMQGIHLGLRRLYFFAKQNGNRFAYIDLDGANDQQGTWLANQPNTGTSYPPTTVFAAANELWVCFPTANTINCYDAQTGILTAQISHQFWRAEYNPFGQNPLLAELNDRMYVLSRPDLGADETSFGYYAASSPRTYVPLAFLPTIANGSMGSDTGYFAHSMLIPLGGALYLFKLNPDTSSGRGIWKYDTALDSWTQVLTGSGLSHLTFNSSGGSAACSYTVGPIESENVAMIVSEARSLGNETYCYIWRPA